MSDGLRLAMMRAQQAQARRLGYRDAATRYDERGNMDTNTGPTEAEIAASLARAAAREEKARDVATSRADGWADVVVDADAVVDWRDGGYWVAARIWVDADDTATVQDRLEYLRGEIEAERISYGEIAELQGLAEHIDPGDVLLLQWAGVDEFGADNV